MSRLFTVQLARHVITGLRTLLWFIISDYYSFLSFSAGFATTGRRPAGFRLLPLAVEPHLQNRESSNVEGSNVVLNGVPIDTLVHTNCTVSYSPHWHYGTHTNCTVDSPLTVWYIYVTVLHVSLAAIWPLFILSVDVHIYGTSHIWNTNGKCP